MATPTDVDRSAPVLAHHEVEIRAPLDTVWQLHIDVNDWPSWQEAMTEAHIDGPFAPGSSFDWSSYGFAVTSQIYEVDDRRRTLWGGTAQGITGVHEWLFAETDGGVGVITKSPSRAIPSAPTSRGCKVSSTHHSWRGSGTSGQPRRAAADLLPPTRGPALGEARYLRRRRTTSSPLIPSLTLFMVLTLADG